jgi:hypothetical protein
MVSKRSLSSLDGFNYSSSRILSISEVSGPFIFGYTCGLGGVAVIGN